MPLMPVLIQSRWLPSARYGWTAVLRNLLPLLSLLWFAPNLADINLALPWLLMPFIGLLLYRMTVVMHDCIHRTLFASARTNEVMGSLLGAITGIAFRSFSAQHWRHHRSFGSPDDPEGFHYLHLNRMTSSQFRWHVVKPLLGCNLRYTLLDSLLAPGNLMRAIRSGEIATIATIQLTIAVLVTGFGRHLELTVLPLVSSATFGLFFSQLRGIAEHGVVSDAPQAGYVRSHRGHWLDRIVLYDVNFNYHREHHDHPEIPSCHLPAVHTRDVQGGNFTNSMFSTLHGIHAALKERR